VERFYFAKMEGSLSAWAPWRDELAQAFAQARKITQRYARTFYFASHALSVPQRWASYALYAFCRAADEVADGPTSDPTQALARLHALLDDPERFHSLYPWGPAWWATVTHYRIPLELFRALLWGVEMDLTKHRYETFEELEVYCYRVASVVGLMMVPVLGYSDDRAFYHAERLGLAMQLTNILRDVGEDWERGRVYLPQEELRRFGCSEAELAQKIYTPGYRALMAFQVERARTFYREGLVGLQYLPSLSARLTVRLMASLYAGILDRLEAESFPNLHKRVYVSLPQKLKLAASEATQELRAQLQHLSKRFAQPLVAVLVGLTGAALFSLHTGFGAEWRWMDSVYLFLWEAAVLGVALQVRGSLRTFLVGALGGGVAEAIGVYTGWPFGAYEYTSVLQPQVGGLPLSIPLAWGALVLYAQCIGPPRNWGGRAIRAALLLTGIDVLLEPFATTGRGYWVWVEGVIPWSNYLSWAVIGGGLAALLPFSPEPSVSAVRLLHAAMASLVILVGSFTFRHGPLESWVAGSLLLGLGWLWAYLPHWLPKVTTLLKDYGAFGGGDRRRAGRS